MITGAAGLLGRAFSLAVLRAGGTAILVDINGQALEEFTAELGRDGFSRTMTLVCDVTDEGSLMRLSDTLKSKIKGLHGLVLNADRNPKVEDGPEAFGRFEHTTLAQWKQEIDVGINGSMLCARIFGDLMIEQDDAASVVFILSVFSLIAPDQRHYEHLADGATFIPPVKPLSYSVTNHAQLGMMRYLSTYWIQKGIRVNALTLGGIRDPNRPLPSIDTRSALEGAIPMGRLGRLEEVGDGLIFLLSDQSTYMTGANLVLDGGRSVW